MALGNIGGSAERDWDEVFPGMILEDKPIWRGLYESVRDRCFPAKLPPLELTSQPIPIVDRMAGRTSRWAVGTSTIVNGGVVAMIIYLGLRAATGPFSTPSALGRIDLSDLNLVARLHATNHGGSGGANEITDPIEGRPPKVELMPIAPPEVAIIDNPKLVVDPAIAAPDIRLPDNTDMPNLGVPKSANVTLVSNGEGLHGGMGTHPGEGDGPGGGPGWGPGSDAGVYVPGRGNVTAPIPIVEPEAEFSDEARQQKYQGICLVGLIVDVHGYPQNVHVVRRLGMGLDEKAMEAISRYRFKPATKDGKPVAAVMTIEVDFRLF